MAVVEAAVAEPAHEQDPSRRAQEAIEFSRGLDEAGMRELARRLRILARDVLELTGALEAERSARRSVQLQRDECLRILERQAAEAIG